MIALLQRVSSASINVQGVQIARIDAGLLVFIGVQRYDQEAQAEKLLEKVLNYRVFPDASGRMNVSLRNRRGALLLVPQFTLAADTRSGTRGIQHGRPTRARPASVRTFRGSGCQTSSTHRNGGIRRGHAGGAGQRWTGDILAGSAAAGTPGALKALHPRV